MNSPQQFSHVPTELKEKLQKSHSIAIFAGAGVSVASGIGTFRSAGKMKYFQDYLPAYICSTEMLQRKPDIAWQFFKHLYNCTKDAQPNLAHQTIAHWQKEAERRGNVRFYLLTTNFDGLLQQAGATNVQELHGNISQVNCPNCNKIQPMSEIDLTIIPPLCSCGTMQQPNIVLLDDYLDEAVHDEALTAIRGCSVYIAIGTSAVNSHAYGFVQFIRQRKRQGQNITLVDINPRGTYLSTDVDYAIQGNAEEILPQFEYHSS